MITFGSFANSSESIVSNFCQMKNAENISSLYEYEYSTHDFLYSLSGAPHRCPTPFQSINSDTMW